jgi:methionine synthase II (cobalamin-independent)
VLEAADGGFVEPFLTAPSPGIVAAAMRNEHYDTEEAYLAALADALRVEYEAIVRHGFLLQLDARTSRSSATSATRTARSPISWASSSGW